MTNIDEEIENEVSELLELAEELCEVYQQNTSIFKDIDSFFNQSIRHDIPGEFSKVSNEIIIDATKQLIFGIDIAEPQVKEYKSKLKMIWSTKSEYDDFMENKDPDKDYYEYRPIFKEILFEAKERAELYNPDVHTLETFLEEECTCKCGKCDYNGKAETTMREINIFCTRVCIEKHIMTNEEFRMLVDKFKEGQNAYYLKSLLKPKNLN